MRNLLLLGLVLSSATGARFLPGVIDTVGGTTFDNQNSAPALQWVAMDPANGVHVAWMYSASPYGSNWPDRTVRYNFYDKNTGAWNWNDTDFMASGINSQTQRTGYGTMEVDPVTGAAVIACHYSAGGMPPTFVPIVTRDVAPGGGIFPDQCDGAPDLEAYFLPVVALTPDRTTHLFVIKFGVSDDIFYTRATSWCTWDQPSGWIQSGGYGENLIASHASNKLIATWMTGNNNEMTLHYRASSDAGTTWDPVVDLTPPAAFGPDTVTVCALGAGLVFDRNDDCRLVTTLVPLVGDSAYVNPAEVWMYEISSATWSKISRAGSGNLSGDFGPNAAICGRPSIGENPDNGRLYVAWEQFDSLNVEPSTNLLRADVYVSSSDDGLFWTEPAMLTSTDETSKRFPVVARNCAGDSLAVFFEQDLIAGFNSDGVGDASNNPICVWRGSGVGGVGIAEESRCQPARLRPVRNPDTRFAFRVNNGGPVELEILDVTGRTVRRFPPALAVMWDGRDALGREAKPGCYLARWKGTTDSGRTKLVLVR